MPCRLKELRIETVGDTEKFWPGAPDLTGEVVSPDDSVRHVQEKALEWIDLSDAVPGFKVALGGLG